MATEVSLTKNQSLVFDTLSEASGPLSAYAILDELRSEGLRAPLQVYRALDKLLKLGMVHRLESLNAFVVCRHPACENHPTITFTICQTCGKVSEIVDDALASRLQELAQAQNFSFRGSTIELRGTCVDCAAA